MSSIELVTRKRKNKSLTTELVTRSEIYIFELRVSNSKRNFLFTDFELLTQTWKKKSLTFELVTQSETFYFLTSS